MEHPVEMEEVSEVLEVSEDVRMDQVNEYPEEITEEVMVEEEPLPTDLQATLAEVDESMVIPKFKTELGTVTANALASFMKRQVKGEKIGQGFSVTLAQKNLDAAAKQKMVAVLKLQNETMKLQLSLERRDRYRVDEENKKFLTHLQNLEEKSAMLSRQVEDYQNVTETLKLSHQQIIEKSKRLDEQYHQDKEHYSRVLEETRKKVESNVEVRKEELLKKKEILADLQRKHEATAKRNATHEEELVDKTANIETMKANCTAVSEKNEKLTQEGQTLRETLSNAQICYDSLIQQFGDQENVTNEKLANLEDMKLTMAGLEQTLDQGKRLNDELSQKVDAALVSYSGMTTEHADSLLEYETKTNELTKRVSVNTMMEDAAAQQLEHLKEELAKLEAEGSNYQKEFDELSREAAKDQATLGFLKDYNASLQDRLTTTRNQRDELLQAKSRLTQLQAAKNEYKLCHRKLKTVLPQLEADVQQVLKNADEKLATAKKSNEQQLMARVEALEMDKRSAANLREAVKETQKKYREKCAKSDSIHNAYLQVLQEIEELKKRGSAGGSKKTPARKAPAPSGVKTVQRKGILKKPGSNEPSPKKVSFLATPASDTTNSEADRSSMDDFMQALFNTGDMIGQQPARTADELFDELQTKSPPERD